jgi:hypothetical protein
MSEQVHGVQAEINMEVVVGEDATVYVKLSGFEDSDDASNYADYLANNLPLLLFESEVMH